MSLFVGAVLAGASWHYSPRVLEAGRVNIIGPLEGTIEVPSADGEAAKIVYQVIADIRLIARFCPYKERAIAIATLVDPAELSPTMPIQALNGSVAELIESSTSEHPQLAVVPVPAFDGSQVGGTAKRAKHRWILAGVALNGLILLLLLAGPFLVFATLGTMRKRQRARNETQSPPRADV